MTGLHEGQVPTAQVCTVLWPPAAGVWWESLPARVPGPRPSGLMAASVPPSFHPCLSPGGVCVGGSPLNPTPHPTTCATPQHLRWLLLL